MVIRQFVILLLSHVFEVMKCLCTTFHTGDLYINIISCNYCIISEAVITVQDAVLLRHAASDANEKGRVMAIKKKSQNQQNLFVL